MNVWYNQYRFYTKNHFDKYLQGFNDQVPGFQLSLQDAEEHQQLWLSQTLHVQLGLQRQKMKEIKLIDELNLEFITFY